MKHSQKEEESSQDLPRFIGTGSDAFGRSKQKKASAEGYPLESLCPCKITMGFLKQQNRVTISAYHEHKSLEISIMQLLLMHSVILFSIHYYYYYYYFAALKIAVVDIYHSRLKERQRRKK